MTITENLQEFREEFEKSRAQFTERARKIFTESLKQLFADNPNLGEVSWTQYTPYFNDGDECTFGVSSVEFFTAAAITATEDYRWEGGDIGHDEETEDMKAVRSFIYNQDDLMEALYGDHVQVIIQRGKEPGSLVVEVEEYQHD